MQAEKKWRAESRRARPRKYASYRMGVEWIALNDDAAETDLETIANYISVALLADLFAKDRARVACDVHRVRKEHAKAATETTIERCGACGQFPATKADAYGGARICSACAALQRVQDKIEGRR